MSYLLPIDILGNPGKDNFITQFEMVFVGISICRHGRPPQTGSSKYPLFVQIRLYQALSFALSCSLLSELTWIQ